MININKRKQKNKATTILNVFLGTTILVLIVILLLKYSSGGEPNDSSQPNDDNSLNSSDNSTDDESLSESDNSSEPDDSSEIEVEPVVDNIWAFYLINQSNPLPDDLYVKTLPVAGDYSLDERCAPYAIEMIEAAKSDGIILSVTSAYRTQQYQKDNFERYYSRMLTEGHTEEQAMAITSQQIASPYTSEHVAGLALDIVSADWWRLHDDLIEEFDQTEEFEWLYENSWKFGFILRYPKSKEDITNIIYEPWHYRFVGKYHAEKIYESELSLEEYFEQYNQ